MSEQLKPLSLIYNKKSGFHAANKDEVYEQLVADLSTAGFEIQSFELSECINFDQMMQDILLRHRQAENVGVVVAAGGDGTLNAVASKLMGTDIPMGILPLGTFNYVARVLNIPLDLLDAAKTISEGQPRSVHVAQLNQHIYLNNASLGLYPLFIQKREQFNKHFGRFPLHAYTSALDVLIRDRKELKLEVEVDGQRYPVKTPLIFFGNNQLQLAEMKLRIAEAAEAGKVAGVVVAKSDKRTLFKILWQLIKGNLDQASDVYSFAADEVIVHSKRNKLTVAVDGEIVTMTPPLKITVRKHALNIMVPA
ncbi:MULTISPECIES: diacylglycerol/lipid kinase family protein [Acinetobacter]|uniref:Diacylglycerol kinase family protein n=2 Tax=Bacteria TaxID=2 RepID=A0AA42GAG4_ACIJO|nr:diacylglycerol kinase family protein [Acinetobacter johnsonii]MBO7706990.1 NAD(+)/NADH kinase [Acinetobacter sp.]MDG9787842.1 diacylglycerol kinase family protein [Acinetobacter johnsonii]MDG9800507.1 diacylglycerol kinase family protein [Acinetobacter johnsonii]MDH1437901.1 diacylglycerol kinase family protein [Acinetobacter johnsonii]RZN87882.1 diacylglycerol kinase [Acinetobacter johnsonii]